ncbi:hypothetical protein B5C34_09555 [Pacificimonas flava]|uniref:Integrase n=2 Tax=Pacificimonas TaxID=1960290 RepID=A0A219B5M0_9SPHN|nr:MULTISPECIES: integrase arm-type DNA-binding domain-containing protein [Pacificimonas]MBZ6379083.1 integrase arm-type DNA-binding domain-containing protein [Pacificimonas aurantium]OWV33682.1 hypothetical protein B5C34_09555 [Pacificimonas flava]
MLTLAAAKAAQPMARAYKLSDAGGLFLFIAPSGLKSWRLKFRWRRREQLLTLGRFPDLSLNQARAKAAAAKAELEEGRDPRGTSTGLSFESVARRWFEKQRPRWSIVHAGDVLSSLERDVFPQIGDRTIGAIGAGELLELLSALENRGSIASAARLRQRLSAIFRFARSQELVEGDPAAELGQAMQAAPLVRPMPAVETPEEAREALAALRSAPGALPVRLAAEFLALTAVRCAAVRGADWAEFEGLETEAPIWRVPAARMKLSRAKKESHRFDHLVPLSPAAIRVLEAAREAGGGRSFPASGPVFCGRGGGPIGGAALRQLHVRAGLGGRHVPHGWRASFSTIMNERRPRDRAAIDLTLAHAPKDKVEAAYNRSAQLELRRDLLDEWGAIISPSAAR